MNPDEQYSDAEATRRMNDAVRRAMKTPHKSHAESAKPRKRKRKKTPKKARAR